MASAPSEIIIKLDDSAAKQIKEFTEAMRDFNKSIELAKLAAEEMAAAFERLEKNLKKCPSNS